MKMKKTPPELEVALLSPDSMCMSDHKNRDAAQITTKMKINKITTKMIINTMTTKMIINTMTTKMIINKITTKMIINSIQ